MEDEGRKWSSVSATPNMTANTLAWRLTWGRELSQCHDTEDTDQKELLVVKFTVMISSISTRVHCMLRVELPFSISGFFNII